MGNASNHGLFGRTSYTTHASLVSPDGPSFDKGWLLEFSLSLARAKFVTHVTRPLSLGCPMLYFHLYFDSTLFESQSDSIHVRKRHLYRLHCYRTRGIPNALLAQVHTFGGTAEPCGLLLP